MQTCMHVVEGLKKPNPASTPISNPAENHAAAAASQAAAAASAVAAAISDIGDKVSQTMVQNVQRIHHNHPPPVRDESKLPQRTQIYVRKTHWAEAHETHGPQIKPTHRLHQITKIE